MIRFFNGKRPTAALALAACAGLMAATAAQEVEAQNQPAFVMGPATKVIDGHTIVVGGATLRILGVHTPKPGELFGHTAQVYTEEAIMGLDLRCELVGEDAMGTAIGRCMADGRELGAIVVEAGAALDCPAQSGGRFQSLESERARELITLPDSCR